MKIDELLIEMIHQARKLNHQPTKVLLGCYMLDELKVNIKDMITTSDSNKDCMRFMGVKIEVSYEFPFLLGIV